LGDSCYSGGTEALLRRRKRSNRAPRESMSFLPVQLHPLSSPPGVMRGALPLKQAVVGLSSAEVRLMMRSPSLPDLFTFRELPTTPLPITARACSLAALMTSHLVLPPSLTSRLLGSTAFLVTRPSSSAITATALRIRCIARSDEALLRAVSVSHLALTP